MPQMIHVSAHELVPKQVIHEYVECEKDQRFACLKYLILKESNNWTKTEIDVSTMDSKSDEKIEKSNDKSFQAMVFIDEDDLSLNVNEIGIEIAYQDLISSIQNILIQQSINNHKLNETKVLLLSEQMSLDQRADALKAFRSVLILQ